LGCRADDDDDYYYFHGVTRFEFSILLFITLICQSILSSRLLSRNVKFKIYRSTIQSFVLYGCETWSLTLRKEERKKVFDNRVLRRIFEPKRDEVTGEWRKLHNEELHNLYSSPDIIRLIKSRRMRWAGHVARMGEERKVWRVLVENPDGERPLGRQRRRWEDGIRTELGRLVGEVRSGFNWLRIKAGGVLL
jgi:hypothetical protein